MELEVELHYFMARSHLPGFNYMKCHADLKSEKPLTIGDTIDHVLKPKRFQIRNHEGEFTGIMEDVTAAEKIEELEKQHNCRFMLSDVHFTLSLNDTKVCRQFFTEAEYVRYKPNPKERSSRQTGKRERTLRTTSVRKTGLRRTIPREMSLRKYRRSRGDRRAMLRCYALAAVTPQRAKLVRAEHRRSSGREPLHRWGMTVSTHKSFFHTVLIHDSVIPLRENCDHQRQEREVHIRVPP